MYVCMYKYVLYLSTFDTIRVSDSSVHEYIYLFSSDVMNEEKKKRRRRRSAQVKSQKKMPAPPLASISSGGSILLVCTN